MSATGPHNPTTFISAEVYLGPQAAPSCSKSGSSGQVDERPVRACPRIFAAHGPHGWVRESVDFWCLGEPGSSEDEVIPQAAIEAAAISLYGSYGAAIRFEDAPLLTRTTYLADASMALRDALPHLRPLFTTATRVGYELGRREAAAEAEERLTELAHRISPNASNPTLGLGTIIRHLREVTKGDPK